MGNKHLALAAAFFGVLALAGFLGADRALAESVSSHHQWSVWGLGTHGLEVLFGFPISKWLTGFVLLLLALILYFARRRQAAQVLTFMAIVQLATRLTAGVLKGVLPRLRPFEVLATGGWDSQWFHDAGSSFPSGHAAHFWGLFFPLAVLRPRLAIWLLPLPLFMSAARVAVNDHYLSDVAASAALAALITLIAHAVSRRGRVCFEP